MILFKRYFLGHCLYFSFSTHKHCILSIEIYELGGESSNEQWTIFLGYQGNFIMVLPSAARLGRLLLKYFFDSIKWVSLVLSADGNTIIFWPF
jgi:hypothetical protein